MVLIGSSWTCLRLFIGTSQISSERSTGPEPHTNKMCFFINLFVILFEGQEEPKRNILDLKPGL